MFFTRNLVSMTTYPFGIFWIEKIDRQFQKAFGTSFANPFMEIGHILRKLIEVSTQSVSLQINTDIKE